MNIRKLRHAVTLARHRNFTKAAAELNITQPALSRSIQALEAEHRLRLFDRDHGGVALTQAGREFIRHAELLLRSAEDLRGVAERASLGHGGNVALGATPLASRILLAPVLLGRVDQPHLRAEVMIANGRKLLTMVMQEQIDLCVCVGELPLGDTMLRTSEIARLPLGVVVRNGHPLTKLKTIGLEDVERFPLIRSRPYSFDDVFPKVATVSRIKAPAVTIQDYDVLSEIAAQSDAVWIMSPHAVRQKLRDKTLVALPIGWLAKPAYIRLSAYYPDRTTLSPIVRSLLDRMREVGAELADSS